ncbi:SURF1 family protein [Thermasporomyces composti]|uniref:SURF1-like protein n=1 Tax=Thermasporomyces composti TaxID=696763 RepID=A0A3D9V0D0_THECX|nr:SURF1 family protein [Thermasporomyces composti]REF34977.1 cytochrome oxidase assembly protein ShyY1 [Thermasporomyces composti]
MYRFLLRPRWIALVLGVAVLVTVFVQLGDWQLDRRAQRQAHNALVTVNSERPPRPVEQVLAPGRAVQPAQEWTRVLVRGRYDADHQVLVRYRPLDGAPGFHVLTPLVPRNGPAVLVDRGWIPRPGGSEAATAPAPPSGEVTVVGRVRRSEEAPDGQGRPQAGQVRFIDTDQLAADLPYPVVDGYVELVEQRPAAQDTPRPVPPPTLSEGPHLAYGLQWYLFAVIAVVGLGLLIYDEAHGGRLRERLRGPDPHADATPPRDLGESTAPLPRSESGRP